MLLHNYNIDVAITVNLLLLTSWSPGLGPGHHITCGGGSIASRNIIRKVKIKFSTPSSYFSSFSFPPPPLAFLPSTSSSSLIFLSFLLLYLGSPHSSSPIPFFPSIATFPSHSSPLLFPLPLLIESNLLLSTSSFTFHHKSFFPSFFSLLS